MEESSGEQKEVALMKLQLSPSKDVRANAKRMKWAESEKWFINDCKTVALLKTYPEDFGESIYLGVVTFRRKEIKDSTTYRLFGKDEYTGAFIKEALRALKTNQVRIYLVRWLKESKLLLLGTNYGTVAIAPIIGVGDSISIFEILKNYSKKFKREAVFLQVFGE